METLIEKVYFRVDFAGMTQHVRSLWAEGSYWKCVETLDALGIPQRYFYAVVDGGMKLVQDPDGKEGVDGMLAKDNWKPKLSACHYQRYPKYEDLSKILNQQRDWAMKYLDSAYIEILDLWKEYNNTRYNGQRSDEIIRQLQTYPVEILEFAGIDMDTFVYEAKYNPIANKFEFDADKSIPGLPSVDEYIKHQLELDKAPKPKPDQTFSIPTGWILPNGKFYGCGWMDHGYISYEVAKLNPEKAQKKGWIKITHPLNQPKDLKIYYGDKEPTQKQLDTLFDWQQKHQGTIENQPGEF